MKKAYRHDELSDRICSNPKCDKQIKKRMVELKDARFCYDCHSTREANRGHTVNTQARRKRVDAGLPVKSF
jgi:hypothetical protein